MTQADRFPEFFDRAPQLLMRDPLAQFLGATPDGVMAYRYQDAVKLAGHSCPTVAGAYLMVVKGLSALYGGDIPERGGIEVLMRDGPDAPVRPPRPFGIRQRRCARRNAAAPARYRRRGCRVLQSVDCAVAG